MEVTVRYGWFSTVCSGRYSLLDSRLSSAMATILDSRLYLPLCTKYTAWSCASWGVSGFVSIEDSEQDVMVYEKELCKQYIMEMHHNTMSKVITYSNQHLVRLMSYTVLTPTTNSGHSVGHNGLSWKNRLIPLAIFTSRKLPLDGCLAIFIALVDSFLDIFLSLEYLRSFSKAGGLKCIANMFCLTTGDF